MSDFCGLQSTILQFLGSYTPKKVLSCLTLSDSEKFKLQAVWFEPPTINFFFFWHVQNSTEEKKSPKSCRKSVFQQIKCLVFSHCLQNKDDMQFSCTSPAVKAPAYLHPCSPSAFVFFRSAVFLSLSSLTVWFTIFHPFFYPLNYMLNAWMQFLNSLTHSSCSTHSTFSMLRSGRFFLCRIVIQECMFCAADAIS